MSRIADSKVQWRPLGEFIEECDERNSDGLFGEADLFGVNNRQTFCATRANVNGIDFRQYKVVHKDYFVYNPARLDIGSIAKYEGQSCIVSTLYEVFKVKDEKLSQFCPEFLQVYFARGEFSRYVGFKNWGSAREYFWIDAMKRTPIPVPPLPVQLKVVETWQGLRKLKEENEKLAGPLMQLCRSYLQECKKKYPMKAIGPMIEPCDERNDKGVYDVSAVRGVSTEKRLIETRANMDGVSLAGYKIVAPKSFVYNPSRLNIGSIACNLTDHTFISSGIYEIFRTKENSGLDPEYLYLNFCRDEFNRYVAFNAWGSVRDSFAYAEMCRVKIPLPPIEVQQAIVDVYRCAKEAKAIAEEADRLSREICPALVRYAAESAEERREAS